MTLSEVRPWKRNAWVFGVLFFVAALAVGDYLVFGSYGEGFRVGTLRRVVRKGYVFKTWEGTLAENGNTDWDFSVDDRRKEVVEAMDRAFVSGHRVKLYYREKFFRMPIYGDTKYMVYQLEEVPTP